MLTLYYTPGTISVAVAIAIEEAALPYQPVRVDFATAEQTKPEYLAINPKGRVPALRLEDDTILTETGALLDYVAAIAPKAGLVPTDPTAAAQMRSAMYYLASTMHVAHAHKMRGSRWAKQQSSFEDMTAQVPETMAACADFVESDILRGPYVLGEDFSLADPYLFVVCNWLEGDGVDTAAYPKITTFMQQITARASVAAVKDKGML